MVHHPMECMPTTALSAKPQGCVHEQVDSGSAPKIPATHIQGACSQACAGGICPQSLYARLPARHALPEPSNEPLGVCSMPVVSAASLSMSADESLPDIWLVNNMEGPGLHPFLLRLRVAFLRMRIKTIAMAHISSSASTMSAMPMPSTLFRPAFDDKSSSGRFALTYLVQTFPDLHRRGKGPK